MFNCLFLLCFCMVCVNTNDNAENDLISSLPLSQQSWSFKQYSGYLKLPTFLPPNDTDGGLFYWFIEAESNPSAAPFVFWFQGGPGQSSLMGLFLEHGPFQLNENGTSLLPRKFSWNKIVNIVYIESPLCVGFSSYPKDCSSSAEKAANLNYEAITSFFKKFSNYRHNSFFLAGESFGGMYVPTLTLRFLQSEARKEYPNFEGFFVNDPYTDWGIMSMIAALELNYRDEITNEEKKGASLSKEEVECCVNNYTTCEYDCNYTQTIDVIFDRFEKSDISYYNLEGKCAADDPKIEKYVRNAYRLNVCINDYPITHYLNNKEVKKAIHVQNISKNWTPTSIPEVYSSFGVTTYGPENNILWKTYTELSTLMAKNDVRGLLAFGGKDMITNNYTAIMFLELTGFNATSCLNVFPEDGDDGTYMEFGPISFMSVKSAGHYLAMDNAEIAFKLFRDFINNKAPSKGDCIENYRNRFFEKLSNGITLPQASGILCSIYILLLTFGLL